MTVSRWSKFSSLYILLSLALIFYSLSHLPSSCAASSSILCSIDNMSTTDYKIDKVYYSQFNTEKILSNEENSYQIIARRRQKDVLRYLNNIYYDDKNNLQNHLKTEFWYWYEKAARQGDAESQFNLGYMYLYGKGVAPDYIKAKYWFERSSNQSDPVAKYFLGLIYYEGKGINKNRTKAKTLFQQSCSEGLSSACCYLNNITG